MDSDFREARDTNPPSLPLVNQRDRPGRTPIRYRRRLAVIKRVDPAAAATVFASGAPIRLIPLDATRRVTLDIAFLQEMQRRAGSPPGSALGRAVVELLGTVESMLKGGTYFAWDPLAAVALVDSSVVRESPLAIAVVQQAPEAGRTRRASSGSPNASVALDADREKFHSLFLDAFTSPAPAR